MTTATITAKPNLYAGRCADCRTTVPAHAGTRHRTATGWAVRHLAGECAEAAVAAPTRIAVEDAGVYVMPDGTVCLVKCNRDHTRTYAKVWREIGGTRVTESGVYVNGDYEYMPGLVARVAAEGRKMTYEEAAAFLVRYGRCIRCARHLKAGVSVERGLGPVCAKWFRGA